MCLAAIVHDGITQQLWEGLLDYASFALGISSPSHCLNFHTFLMMPNAFNDGNVASEIPHRTKNACPNDNKAGYANA